MSYKKDYVSFSALKAFSNSPNHYIDYVSGTAPDSDAFRFGRAFHAYILEYDVFHEMYAICPKVDRRTKAGKETYNEFKELNKQRTIVSHGEYQKILAIEEKLTDIKAATELLENTKREQWYEKEYRGIKCKGIVDAHNDNYSLDLKTTRNANAAGMQKSIFNFSYHVQAAMYVMLTGTERFYWIACEKEAPYNVGVYMASEATLSHGKALLDKWIDKYQAWDGQPMSYSPDIEEITIYQG